jgi:hypothetical protein
MPAPMLPRHRGSMTPYKVLGARVRAITEGQSVQKAAKALYADHLDFDAIVRAASSPATLTDPGWAGPVGRFGVSQAVEDIVAMSALGRLLQFGALKIDLGRLASVTVPGRITNAASAGTWVAEGQPVQVKQYSITGPKLSPHKLEVNTSITFEMSRTSNIEDVLRVLITEAAGLAIDGAVLSTAAATPAQSAGLLHGLTALTPSTASGFDACGADLGKLVSDIASRGGGSRAAFIAAPSQATSIRFFAGGQFGVTAQTDVLPVAASAALADGTVVCLEPESFVCTLGEVSFDTTTGATLHFEDTSPQDIANASGTVAVPVKSMFQTDSIALRMTLFGADWCMRAPHVSYMTGVQW